MSMKRKKKGGEQEFWLPTHQVKIPANRFYERLNLLLNANGFDSFVEELCVRMVKILGRTQSSLESE